MGRAISSTPWLRAATRNRNRKPQRPRKIQRKRRLRHPAPRSKNFQPRQHRTLSSFRPPGFAGGLAKRIAHPLADSFIRGNTLMRPLPTMPQRTWLERASLGLAGTLLSVGLLTIASWWLHLDEVLQPFRGQAP